jgi:hypothetical protein
LDRYRVCGKKCQAQDWKDHKQEECYVHDAILAKAVKQGNLLQQQKQKTCPICMDDFCELDLLRHQVEEMPCGHVSHKGCLAEMSRSHMEQLNSGGDLEKLFQCPLCRQYTGQSIGYKKKTPWFQLDSAKLIHMALGFVFQRETRSQGTEEEEILFIAFRIRDTEEETKLGALKSLNKAKEEFERVLPTLWAAESVQERENLTMRIKVLITWAVMSHLVPGFLSQEDSEVEPDADDDEIEKWNPHVYRWLGTLQIIGPYVWD